MPSRLTTKNLARAVLRPSNLRQGFIRRLHAQPQAPRPLPPGLSDGSNGKSHYLWAAAGGLAVASLLYNISPVDSSLAENSSDAAVSVAGDPHRNLIAYDEVLRHNTQADCWVIINGEVYDVTKFIEIHPGGVNAILKMAGKDATKAFMPIHPPDALASLPPEYHVGTLDPTTAPASAYAETEEEIRIRKAREALPHPEAAINLEEIESLAKSVLTTVAYAYYSSAGDDEYTFRENAYAFKRYWFRPRVMNRVSQITTSTTFLGYPVSLPVFICPAALARLGHPEGELNIVQAAAKEGIAQGLSINASCSLDEIKEVKAPDQTVFFQIYLDRNRKNSEALLRRVENDGYKGIILTVDSAVPGKRERDMRAKGDFQAPASGGANTNGAKGVAQAISGYQDPDITWDDIAWIRSITKLPLMIKGIQSVEDVEKAYKHGVKAVVLSNHGGRSLDFSPPPIDLLYELRQKRPDLLTTNKFEVYIDGGIRRGTDVLKALCLGAKGVGLGRPILYGNTGWGEDGVRRVIQIIREEVETGMRLLGVTRVEDLKPEMVRYVGHDPAPRQ